MLKKLQNLLFEDEDDDEEDEEEETEVKEEKVHPAPVQQPVQQPAPKPQPIERPVVQPQPQPQTIQRIDVERPASSVNTQENKKQSLGITVDDVPTRKEEKKPVRQAAQKKPEPKKQEKKQPVYEFKPVISPIFGIDEKDVNALKTTNQRISRQERQKDRQDANITPIISPMYGPEASSKGARSMDDASVNIPDDVNDDIPDTSDDLPDFSLDDILKSRDQEFDKNKKEPAKDEPVFPDLEDEPLPDVNKVSTSNVTQKADDDDDFFPDLKFDDEDDANDTTSVIQKQDIDHTVHKK